jgi:hypothetical protein|tara:strand:- start:359 stop:544 length:186 start_codon:yes stop_codon:yes gene_type:complete
VLLRKIISNNPEEMHRRGKLSSSESGITGRSAEKITLIRDGSFDIINGDRSADEYFHNRIF